MNLPSAPTSDDLTGFPEPGRRYRLDEPIHPMQIAAFRRMTTGQKLDAMAQMYQMARGMIAAQVRAQHPDWDQETLQREVSRRFLHGTS